MQASFMTVIKVSYRLVSDRLCNYVTVPLIEVYNLENLNKNILKEKIKYYLRI